MNAVAFSPDARQVLTADGDGTAILWPAVPWQTEAGTGQ
ncbi:MAG: WD40 domain-containing protein [Pirellulaceae bacterium]|nr:WD40 domain-containing protein [Pirellulaceae bacterium]